MREPLPETAALGEDASKLSKFDGECSLTHMTYTHTHVYTHTCTHTHTRVYTHTHTHTHIHTNACMHTCTHMAKLNRHTIYM